MAKHAKTLQSQGVPIPSRLRGPQATRRQVVNRTKTPNGTQTTTDTYENPANTRNRRPGRNRSALDYSPTRVADKATTSVGLLEIEFLGSLLLLIMLMFANSSATYADKIMSIMKRGTLICLLFFLLALISGIGPNATKIAKAIGALVVVGILLTAPVNDMITDVDSLIKNDWVGSAEHGTDVGSSDTGTSSSSSSGGGALGAASGAIQRITSIIENFGFGIIK
jgi:hypothetical protein